MGIKPVSKAIQIESMDDALRNALWNQIRLCILENMSQVAYRGSKSQFEIFAELLWDEFFGLAIDDMPSSSEGIIKFIRNWFYQANWHEAYDLIDFLASDSIYDYADIAAFIDSCNKVLEREVSGYRFVDGIVVPISHELEISEIEEALAQAQAFTSLTGANIHLHDALGKIADRTQPDYRNSIKESLSAVETTVRMITGASTLGDGLKKLENKGIFIDKQLKEGFEKHYAYSNNKSSGIRHSILEEHQSPDFHDAKYMLVTCCAFINYLVGKTAKTGLSF